MMITTRRSDMSTDAPRFYVAPLFPEAASALHQSTTSAEQMAEDASRSHRPDAAEVLFSANLAWKLTYSRDGRGNGKGKPNSGTLSGRTASRRISSKTGIVVSQEMPRGLPAADVMGRCWCAGVLCACMQWFRKQWRLHYDTYSIVFTSPDSTLQNPP